MPAISFEPEFVDVILGGTPASNNLAWKIMRLCHESECMGFEIVGMLESIKYQLIAEAYSKMMDATKETNQILQSDDLDSKSPTSE